MTIDKSILNQYISEKQEILELRVKIERLESKISRIEQRIAEIEEGHTVKDKVRGGEGGLQSFVIEGVPYDEYNDKLSDLAFAKKSLYHTKEVIKAEEMRFILRTKEVEQFISSINDSMVRRIARFRVVDGLSWNEVANKIGGDNTEDSVRMCFERFLKKY